MMSSLHPDQHLVLLARSQQQQPAVHKIRLLHLGQLLQHLLVVQVDAPALDEPACMPWLGEHIAQCQLLLNSGHTAEDIPKAEEMPEITDVCTVSATAMARALRVKAIFPHIGQQRALQQASHVTRHYSFQTAPQVVKQFGNDAIALFHTQHQTHLRAAPLLGCILVVTMTSAMVAPETWSRFREEVGASPATASKVATSSCVALPGLRACIRDMVIELELVHMQKTFQA